jgi:catechol 2,3-dioxygenase-like lactoylglutathione lyase family enzyme
MASQLHALCFDSLDPASQARFWAEFLGREMVDDGDGSYALLPSDASTAGDGSDGVGFRLRFVPTSEKKTSQNRAHFDLTSDSPADQQQKVATALGLGAQHCDVGQLPEEEHVVLADPEGNEFCVIEAGNNFLAGCGFIGALSCDGSQAVGYFWSQALGWPLVWDENEETAIQSPRGGTKITWGGPPLMPRLGRDRIRFELALPIGGNRAAEIDRLIGLGATALDAAGLMADPDGNEFRVVYANR